MIRRLWCATWLGHRPCRMACILTRTRRCRCGRVEVGDEDWFRNRHAWDRLASPAQNARDWASTIIVADDRPIPSTLDMVGRMEQLEHNRWLHGA